MTTTDSTITRRAFIAAGGAALAATATRSFPLLAAPQPRLRMALVGTGNRGSLTWGQEVVKGYSDVVEIVGLCDINRKRAEAGKALIGINAPTFVDFDRMINETRPDTVMVTTVDGTHYRYIIRGLELGCNVMTEKPLCTDEQQCQAILDAQKKSSKKITVTFNARHAPEAKKVKQLLLEKAVGDVISVDFHEYLDTSHGADYFRRWHRLKQNSGTLLVHKASHHFDLANWWLDSMPMEVTAFGDLKFYGHNNSFRSTHCRVCPYKQQCKFYWDVTQNPQYVKLYTECESEDGYLRDGCVWRDDINIYDTMSVVVKYENGVHLTYTANTYLPYEGQSVSINGSRGRLDYTEVKANGFANNEVRLTRSFGKSEAVKDLETSRAGSHGGADSSMQDQIFRGAQGSDPLNLRAGLHDGALSSLVGIAARHSIERGSQTVKINDLVKL
ncbi:MAG: 4,5-dihydroxyphthalate dehydrogenase [Acidobacteria bacterium]|nr:MAG: 4,5-dihydroxyphthalate dehydrogenase [Acidobacteriota bacterium]PYY06295.1 MAG: 4,5-dihydroxyphthalate dehydrogenase [Acidobacteriota bacterium]